MHVQCRSLNTGCPKKIWHSDKWNNVRCPWDTLYVVRKISKCHNLYILLYLNTRFPSSLHSNINIFIFFFMFFQAVIVQDPVPGRVKTVTPYFDKMPSVIVTKTTQHWNSGITSRLHVFSILNYIVKTHRNL